MFYFRCTTNPKAAVLTVDHLWEAQEMRKHPDYQEVDSEGFPVLREEDSAPNRIPFMAAGGKK